MPGTPPHSAARRDKSRARRRRGRLIALGTAFVIVALLVGLAIDTGAGTGSKSSSQTGRGDAARARHTGARATRPRHPPRGRLAAAMAAGNARIQQLARLGLPIYCGGPHGHEVAFTFDDGPGVYTHIAIRKLRRAHERATFFVVGRNVNDFRGYLPRELKVGAIGDHTYTHPDLLFLSPGEVTSQLSATARLIRAKSGEQVDLFRPPYEAHNATVDRIARRLGLLEVLWSVDSQDSLAADWRQIISNVEVGLRPGAIILMHENHGQTIRALTTLLPALRRRHLRSVSVPELLASDPPSLARLRRGWAGCGERARTNNGLGSGS